MTGPLHDMRQPLSDTWYSNDVLVLRHIVAEFDKEDPHDMTAAEISNRMRVDGQPWYDIRLVESALKALVRDGLITMELTEHPYARGLQELRVVEIDSRAYALTGKWPSPDSIAERLLTELMNLAERSDDPVTRSKAKTAAKALGSFSRDTLVSVIGAAAGVAMQ